MTIAHRVFSTAFDARHGRPLPQVGRARYRDADPTDSLHVGPTGSITCSPWEGLYLEEDGTAEPAIDNSVEISTALDRFLSSMMYGE
ncbi:hypothetical protein F8G81_11155 [Arthrobacter sp. CDRTa11]|uniref:hypothetical protein n=1 Tax=Arthrobacter sp. CDRTa11 TaxID=2651199 RepID=UPI002265A93B|nr:hypothetical protein [Arthrobacter sp. CDRTa11]UZX03089.1 hypothetical protein F8G81_11155 [Arthrobacter sp. CDRTa11]